MAEQGLRLTSAISKKGPVLAVIEIYHKAMETAIRGAIHVKSTLYTAEMRCITTQAALWSRLPL